VYPKGVYGFNLFDPGTLGPKPFFKAIFPIPNKKRTRRQQDNTAPLSFSAAILSNRSDGHGIFINCKDAEGLAKDHGGKNLFSKQEKTRPLR